MRKLSRFVRRKINSPAITCRFIGFMSLMFTVRSDEQEKIDLCFVAQIKCYSVRVNVTRCATTCKLIFIQ